MKYLTMSELEDIGFTVDMSYTHDQYMTQRRIKGCLQVETTWLKTGEFVSQDLTIDEVNCITFVKNDLAILDKILNKKDDTKDTR